MTSLQGPVLTTFGFACLSSNAVRSNPIVSLKLAGGLAFMSEPSSSATAATESAPMLSAMRRSEPIVLIAKGIAETVPPTVGFSINNALPPPGCFISRSASSVISNSVAIGSLIRINSPERSRCARNSRKESKAMPKKLNKADQHSNSPNEPACSLATLPQIKVIEGHQYQRMANFSRADELGDFCDWDES